jgi:hypothetical protein
LSVKCAAKLTLKTGPAENWGFQNVTNKNLGMFKTKKKIGQL